MARNRGIFDLAANIEPKIGQPLDARALVDYKLDLINPLTWTDGNRYLYDGMIVLVSKDTDENCGIYWLKDREHYTEYNAWVKIVDGSNLKELAYKDLADIIGGTLDSSDDRIELRQVLPEGVINYFGFISVDKYGRVVGLTPIDVIDGNTEDPVVEEVLK